MAGPRINVKLPNANGVAAGQTASFRVPLGRTTHRVEFSATNLTLAEIEGIRVILNGQIVMTYASGTELNNFNLLDQIATAGSGDFSNPLILNFDSVNYRNGNAEEITAIGSGHAEDKNPVSTFEIEIDIASGATGVTLEAHATQSGPQQLGAIKFVKQFNYAPSATGIFEIGESPKGDILRRVIFNSSEISKVEIQRDNYTIFDRTQARADFLLAADGFRNALASKYVIDTGEGGRSTNGIVTSAQDFRLKLTMSGTTAFTGVYEYVGILRR